MGNREDTHNDPWVGSNLVKPLGRAKKKMEICLQKRVKVLAPYFS